MSKILRRPPKVIVLVLSAFKVQRECLRGIIRYSRLYGPWEFHILEGRDGEQSVLNLKKLDGNGLIAFAQKKEYVQAILHAKIPTIVIDPWDDFGASIPSNLYNIVQCDTQAIGRTAADFFLQQNYKNFAFINEANNQEWSRERGKGFAKQLKKAGFECSIYENQLKDQMDWGLEQNRLKKWLLKLPKPIAVLAAMDVRGRQVIEICRSVDLAVPDEVAVLGVDNDEILCESTYPPMSSMAMTIENACFRGAAVLDRLMRGGNQQETVKIFYGPGAIVSRRSTDTNIISDKFVIDAVEFIRLNTDIQINVADVVAHLGISRRSAEIRFKKELRCSILDEINRVRLEKVENFLQQTNLPISQIAGLTGFNNENYLSFVFKKKHQMTMSEYRKLHLASHSDKIF
ncbi:MAG: XylR family transcriptional regulator [Planctomycetia bacterium]|nr:XylR family transcriptional regulator [Planctomycetia bacterium]